MNAIRAIDIAIQSLAADNRVFFHDKLSKWVPVGFTKQDTEVAESMNRLRKLQEDFVQSDQRRA